MRYYLENNLKLQFLCCLNRQLTAYKPKSWGGWEILCLPRGIRTPNQRCLQWPKDENSWTWLEINRLRAAHSKPLVCMKYWTALVRGAGRNLNSFLKFEFRAFSNENKRQPEYRLRSNGNAIYNGVSCINAEYRYLLLQTIWKNDPGKLQKIQDCVIHLFHTKMIGTSHFIEGMNETQRSQVT